VTTRLAEQQARARETEAEMETETERGGEGVGEGDGDWGRRRGEGEGEGEGLRERVKWNVEDRARERQGIAGARLAEQQAWARETERETEGVGEERGGEG
jgi:hypothetical protein